MLRKKAADKKIDKLIRLRVQFVEVRRDFLVHLLYESFEARSHNCTYRRRIPKSIHLLRQPQHAIRRKTKSASCNSQPPEPGIDRKPCESKEQIAELTMRTSKVTLLDPRPEFDALN
jgi:hypothetical protein